MLNARMRGRPGGVEANLVAADGRAQTHRHVATLITQTRKRERGLHRSPTSEEVGHPAPYGRLLAWRRTAYGDLDACP